VEFKIADCRFQIELTPDLLPPTTLNLKSEIENLKSSHASPS
jgi:hypothetical protein